MTPILHLSLVVRDLDEARAFYVDLLGCAVGRVRDGWFDVDFFGCQTTLHHDAAAVGRPRDEFHFGATIDWARWHDLVPQLVATATVVDPPEDSYVGTPQHQAKVTIADPTGHGIELKAYRDVSAALERA